MESNLRKLEIEEAYESTSFFKEELIFYYNTFLYKRFNLVQKAKESEKTEIEGEEK